MVNIYWVIRKREGRKEGKRKACREGSHRISLILLSAKYLFAQKCVPILFQKGYKGAYKNTKTQQKSTNFEWCRRKKTTRDRNELWGGVVSGLVIMNHRLVLSCNFQEKKHGKLYNFQHPRGKTQTHPSREVLIFLVKIRNFPRGHWGRKAWCLQHCSSMGRKRSFLGLGP